MKDVIKISDHVHAYYSPKRDAVVSVQNEKFPSNCEIIITTISTDSPDPLAVDGPGYVSLQLTLFFFFNCIFF